MKTLIIIILFILSFKSYAGERRLDTGYGFFVNVPLSFAYFGHETSESIIEKMRDDGLNVEPLTELDLRGDGIYFINMNQYIETSYPDEISIRIYNTNYMDIFTNNYDCEGYRSYLSSMVNKQLKQYKCELTEIPKIKLGNALFTKHEGAYSSNERNIAIQYFITKNKLVAFSLNCVIETCNSSEETMIEMIKSVDIID